MKMSTENKNTIYSSIHTFNSEIKVLEILTSNVKNLINFNLINNGKKYPKRLKLTCK
jgi:hypothetical protein